MSVATRASQDAALDSLGLESNEAWRVRRLVQAGHGLVLVAGPKRSGRSTTLHALRREFEAHTGRAVAQVSAAGIHDLFRDVPDAVLADLPNLMVDCALVTQLFAAVAQGAFVLASLPGERAHHVFFRLRALGVSREELAAGLTLVMAQTLVQTLCESCSSPDDSEAARSALAHACNTWLDGEKARPRCTHAGGCAMCHASGGAGRSLLYECIEIDSSARALLEEGVPSGVMEQTLLGDGRSMWDQGLRRFARGEISLGALRQAAREPR